MVQSAIGNRQSAMAHLMPILLKRLAGGLVIILVLIAVNQYMSDQGLFGFGVPPYYARVIMLAGINVILAVSLNLITGFTGQFSIGHAGFMAVGAYSSAYLTVYHAQTWEHALAGIVGTSVAHASIFVLAIIVGSVVAALAGLIVGIPSLRLRGDYLAIVTLGFAEIIRIVILNIDKVGGATGFTVPGYTNFIWVGAFAIITIIIVHNIVHSDVGRALVSIREDELAAEAMGINTTRYKVLAFVISSALAGMAGVLFGHYTSFLSTNDFQFIRSFEIIIMIVLGGMGSLTGSVIGAVVITLLPELLRSLGPKLEDLLHTFGVTTIPPSLHEFLMSLANYRLVIYSALLILIMLTRPQGLFGTREFGLSWLKRPQRRPEGDKPVGDKGVPIANQPPASGKEAKNR
ncbi:MAG TPA: branched-chain amino acid ABC transporter permease [Pyrinomonadaceae bacterium]|nr:branched-chain amino acid ABC transporter permease [Pyrinomonadaceae bacterium]